MLKKGLGLMVFLLFGSIFGVSQADASSFGVIEEGTNRTLVPLRMISDAFSVPIEWDNRKKVVTIDQTYTLEIGSKMIRQNGTIVKEMDVQPKMIQSSVYVPVKYIGTLFDATMTWNQQKQQVEFTVKDQFFTIPSFPEAIVKKPKVSVTTKMMSVSGKKFSVNVASINLLASNTTLQVALANNNLGSVGTLASIAKNHGAKVAINGNFFDAYSNSATRLVYNGLVMNGKKMKPFDLKFSVFYYTEKGDVGILPGDAFMDRFAQGDVQEALQVGPRLVTNGTVTVNPQLEGFSSYKILSSAGARSGLGILKNRQVVFVTTSGATVQQLASIMKQLGAVDAMNLDGGASSGLLVNNRYLTTPGRLIAVALLVK